MFWRRWSAMAITRNGAIAAVAALFFVLADAQSASFNGFTEGDSSLVSTGNALVNRSGILLTRDFRSHGRTMLSQAIPLCMESSRASFSTSFTFLIQRQNHSLVNADGLAFTIAPNLEGTSDESYGRWLGLYDGNTNGKKNGIVGVEFDTFMNRPPDYPEFQDKDDNHVGLNLGSIVSQPERSLSDAGISLHASKTVAAKIDYNATEKNLKVYVSYDTSFKPSGLGTPFLDVPVDLCLHLLNNTSSFVGFSAGSGTANIDYHRILSWNFTTTPEKLTPIPRNVTTIPNNKGSNNKNRNVILASTVNAAIVLVVVFVFLEETGP